MITASLGSTDTILSRMKKKGEGLCALGKYTSVTLAMPSMQAREDDTVSMPTLKW